MHYYLSSASPSGSSSLALKIPMPVTPSDLSITESQLLEYFEHTASRALAVLGHDPMRIRSILIPMALIDTSPSSTAVRQALLGLSSLHRYGVQTQAFEFKISAIKSLKAASHTKIGAAEALQHVAAGMLLCSFEIHRASCTSSQWHLFINGVKQVLYASSIFPFKQDSVVSTMMDWVFYHHSIGRFSTLHWRPALHTEYCPPVICWSVSQLTPSPTNTLLILLNLGYQILSAIPESVPAGIPQTLGRELQSFSLPDTPDPTFELFHLAILVYFNRMTACALEPRSITQTRIQRALTIFAALDSCPRQFPLFIIGCEARTDEERCTVLELIDRTEKTASSRSVVILSALIKAVWVQDDLAGDRELDYREKMTAIISVCSLMPMFV
ncbi:fungal-specific transcription factor domain-containing protein [Aspergillus terricola var. indicus]